MSATRVQAGTLTEHSSEGRESARQGGESQCFFKSYTQGGSTDEA